MKRVLILSSICLAIFAFSQFNPSDAGDKPVATKVAKKVAIKVANKATTKAAKKPTSRPAAKPAAKPAPLYSVDTAAEEAPPAYTRLAQVLNSQVLRVCVRSDSPPFGYLLSGKLTGFDVALARLLTRKISIYYKKNLHIAWKIVKANGRISSLQKNHCDIAVATFSVTAERAKKVAFSKVYYKTDKVLVMSDPMNSKEPVIGVTSGATAPTQGLKGTLLSFNDYSEITFAMSAGDVDYVIADRPTATHMIRSASKTYKIAKSLGKTEAYAVGINKNNTHLLEVINKALKSLANSGDLAYLQRQWL